MSEEKVGNDRQVLIDAKAKGTGATLGAFVKLSGPGWLQSAITLGGGSLAGSLFLGVIGGYSMLWVQVLAMILGVIMLSAISYVTLSTESSPFQGIRKHINPVLAWGWLIASLAANMVWVMPQYSLAFGAVTDNLIPSLAPTEGDGIGRKFMISIVIFAIVTFITMCYGKKGKGIKIYETVLKLVVACIVLCFMGVVAKLMMTDKGLPIGEILFGFLPNFSHISSPAATYQAILDTITDPAIKEYWTAKVLSAQEDRMYAAAATAVGINMTFLLPFSLLAKKWNKDFRGLAIFDLSTGMIIPFILATSCVVIASASMFHTQPYAGLLKEESVAGKTVYTVAQDSSKVGDYNKAIGARNGAKTLAGKPMEETEKRLAAMLIKRDVKDFAKSLEVLVGKETAQYVFGFGVLAMAMSTISLLMLISGFCVCEGFGFPHGGKEHKLGTLLGASGLLWPLFWTGSSKAYLAVPTSVIGLILLPIAFFSFIMMMNSKRMLGEHRPEGGKRLFWNILMGLSFVITGAAAVKAAWKKSLTIGDTTIPFGMIALLTFVVLVVIGQIYAHQRNLKEDQNNPPSPPSGDSSSQEKVMEGVQ